MSSHAVSFVAPVSARFRSARRLATLVLVAALASACTDASPTAPDDSDPSKPQAGTLLLQLSEVQSADAAFQLEVRGVRLTEDITAASPELKLHVRQRGDVWQVAVFGTATNGDLLRLRVPDVQEVARYTIRVTDVARGDGTLRSTEELDLYRGTVRRIP